MNKISKYVTKTYKLTRKNPGLSLTLASRHTRRYPLLYFDEETGTNKSLRYARNQNSPFIDEQDGNAILEPIVFENGFLTVQKENQNLQRFLALHPGNGRTFVEIDKKKDAQGKNHTFNLNNISFSEQNESLENNLIKGKKILEGLKCKGIPIS